MRVVLALMVVGLFCGAKPASEVLPPAGKVAAYLQEISVTIKSGTAEGSGVIRTVPIDGKAVNFVLTAAHVVDDLRKEDQVIDPKTGTKRVHVTFRDAAVVKELVEDGRRVGELKMDATVFRFSKSEDLAILRVRKRDFVKASVVFYDEEAIPQVGLDLYHVGSLLGQMGSNSLTSGIISQIGRTIGKSEYDQTTCTAFPGSSGGGVYTREGRYIGMITRGAGEGFNLMVPIRRIDKWCDSAGMKWVLDGKAKPPTEAEMEALPVEDSGVKFGGDEKAFPTLIRKVP